MTTTTIAVLVDVDEQAGRFRVEKVTADRVWLRDLSEPEEVGTFQATREGYDAGRVVMIPLGEWVDA